jgi:ketosteroid isomerase-like protein
MSRENVEVVRTWLAPWDGVDAAAVFRDDATWTRSRAEFEAFFESDYAIAWIAQGQRVLEASGWDDSRRGWLDWLEPWETYHVHIERIVPVADKVVVLTRLHGRMAATQKEVEMLGGSVYLVRDGRVARVQHYADRAEALEAAALRE